MPYYDFKCKTCDKVITVQRDIEDRNVPVPPHTNECEGFIRIWTPVQFRFEGGKPSDWNPRR